MSFIGDIFDGIFGGASAAEDAAQLQVQGARQGQSEIKRQFDITQGLIAPQIEAGDLARQQQLALLGLLGPEAQAQANTQFTQSPGQKFIQDRQQRALLRGASATGNLRGGNIQTALQEQAAGFAQQDFGNQFNRLAGLSGSGQTATGKVGQFGQTASGNIANLLQAQGQAGASGVLGAQQANAGLAQNAISIASSFFSDDKLKTDIKEIGRLGKLKLYSWIWKDSGKSDKGLIAQQVQKVLPQFVTEINGFLAVDYNQALKAA